MSNCNSKSGKEIVIRKLKKYLGVDVYGRGRCSDPGLQCPQRDENKCMDMLSSSYKVTKSFTLTFVYIKSILKAFLKRVFMGI